MDKHHQSEEGQSNVHLEHMKTSFITWCQLQYHTTLVCLILYADLHFILKWILWPLKWHKLLPKMYSCLCPLNISFVQLVLTSTALSSVKLRLKLSWALTKKGSPPRAPLTRAKQGYCSRETTADMDIIRPYSFPKWQAGKLREKRCHFHRYVCNLGCVWHLLYVSHFQCHSSVYDGTNITAVKHRVVHLVNLRSLGPSALPSS